MLLTELDIRKLAVARIKFLETGEGHDDARGRHVLRSACHGNSRAVAKLRELGEWAEGTYPEWELRGLKAEIQDAVLGAKARGEDNGGGTKAYE